MRPIQLSAMPHYFQSKMHRPQQHLAHQLSQPHTFLKKPISNAATAASSLSKITFHSSPQGPNSGEYIFENPFNHGSTPTIVCA